MIYYYCNELLIYMERKSTMTRGKFEALYVNYNGTMIINDETEKQEILRKYLEDKKVCLYVDSDMYKLEIVSFAELFSKRLQYREEYQNDEEFFNAMEMKALNALKVSKRDAYKIMSERHNW